MTNTNSPSYSKPMSNRLNRFLFKSFTNIFDGAKSMQYYKLMRMKNTLNYLLLAVTTLLFSCENDSFSPRKYTKYAFIPGEVRMFTRNGEITDKETIKKFENRVRNVFLNSIYSDNKVFSFNDDSKSYDEYDFELFFKQETSGIVTYKDDQNEKTVKFNLHSNSGYQTIYLQDTVTNIYYKEDPMFLCKPDIIKTIPIFGGDIVKYLRPIYVKRMNDGYAICLVSYMTTSYSNNEMRSIEINGVSNNLLSNDYLNSLKKQPSYIADTIAFKESYILFK